MEEKLAVLIDADNVPYANIKEMLGEMAKIGIPTIKRIYSDWTKPSLSGWKSVLLENAITPIQQYSYTTGKNASDSAMIIDAMDILYSDKVDGFCIVSSDSDFTRLAIRLREAGMKVYGFGEKKTPLPFITACDKFTYIEILKASVAETATVSQKLKDKTKKETQPLKIIDPQTLLLIRESVSDAADESGWASLAVLGSLLAKKKTDFDPRNYGFPKLLPFIKSLKIFEIDERDADNDKNVKYIFIRIKKALAK